MQDINKKVDEIVDKILTPDEVPELGSDLKICEEESAVCKKTFPEAETYPVLNDISWLLYLRLHKSALSSSPDDVLDDYVSFIKDNNLWHEFNGLSPKVLDIMEKAGIEARKGLIM